MFDLVLAHARQRDICVTIGEFLLHPSFKQRDRSLCWDVYFDVAVGSLVTGTTKSLEVLSKTLVRKGSNKNNVA